MALKNGLGEDVTQALWTKPCGGPVLKKQVPFANFFFHEYGRRVGMVPRSSLKEGKKRQMVEKGTKTPKTNPKPNTQARRPTPPSCSLPYTLGETCETETNDN